MAFKGDTFPHDIDIIMRNGIYPKLSKAFVFWGKWHEEHQVRTGEFDKLFQFSLMSFSRVHDSEQRYSIFALGSAVADKKGTP